MQFGKNTYTQKYHRKQCTRNLKQEYKKCNPYPKPENYSLESHDIKKQEHSLPGKNSTFLRLELN